MSLTKNFTITIIALIALVAVFAVACGSSDEEAAAPAPALGFPALAVSALHLGHPACALDLPPSCQSPDSCQPADAKNSIAHRGLV